jgi:hypothetical protein
MGGQKRRTSLIVGRIWGYPCGKRLNRTAGHASDTSRVDHHIVGIPKERFDADNIITAEIGPAVVTHAGPGTRGIFL